MRRASKKITGGFLAAAMMIPTFGQPVLATETADPAPVTEQEYKIYPTPHSITYTSSATTISSDVNVVYADGIDQYTKDHAEDVFSLLGDDVQVSVGSDTVEGKTNVLIGIEGDQSKADAYFDTHTIKTADLFGKNDAYALEISEGTIVVLGESTDAAFHGLTSLKHIFNQVENKTVRDLRMEDYADVKTRGFIEGYYGNPWSFEDRADLMRFGGDYKLNGYFYAPKDDPKHNAKWRELYTAEELENHRMIAEAGNESKCYYIYALHPFMYGAMNFGDGYDADLQIIKNKFEQMMGVGVKQFAILADDAGVPNNNPSNYVRLMTDLTNWLKEKQETVPGLKSDMVFCPNDYMGNGSSSQMQTLKNLPDSVSIIETGGMVWGTVGPSFNNTFYNNMGRPAFMWINWPCSDNTKDSLIMGAALRFLAPGTNPDTVDGIVLNPMQQSEPSKQGLFTNADYAWNIWENADKYKNEVWPDSFNYIDHGTNEETAASAGLRELSKHMQYSRTPNTEESEDIKDALAAFGNKLANGDEVSADIPALRAEYEKLQQAAKDYREGAGNKRTLGQIIYWIDAWDDMTAATLGYFDTIEKIEAGEPLSEIWDSFSKAQALRDQSETHTFHYVDHDEFAKAGTKYLTPFMNRLDALVSDMVLPLVDPSAERVRIITSRTDTPEGSITNATDGNPATEIVYKTPSSVAPGDYFGILRDTPIDVDSVSILLGRSGNLNDTFPKAKIQYTTDGKTWVDYGEETTSCTDMSQTGMNLKGILGLRVYCTGTNPNIWLGVRDFVLNPGSGSTTTPTTAGTLSIPANNGIYQSYAISRAYDGDSSTFLWTNQEAKVGDTFTWTYDEPVLARNVHIEMGNGAGADKWTNYVLETTADGSTWTEKQSFNGSTTTADTFDYDLQNEEVKGVRIRATSTQSKWIKLTEFTVELTAGDPYSEDHLLTNTEIDAGVFYTATSSKLKAEGSITLQPGEYLGMDLERIVDVTSVNKGTDAEGLVIESSRNNYEWAAFDEANPGARYVRMINSTDAPITFTMTGDMIVSCEPDAVIHLEESDMGKHATYGGQDTRNNGGAFDGDVNTTTVFADYPQEGQSIVYDLAQVRTISKLELFAQDSATNYITDADVLISTDKENWTKVFTIGDGVENEDELSVNAVNSDAGYQANSTYPNKVTVSGTIDPTPARFIKIAFTADNNVRFATFNEIVINDGEYVPVYNAAFRTDSAQAQGFIPANLFDGNLSSAWTPATDAAGYIEYDYSEGLDKNHFNVISKGDSTGATFSIRAVKDGVTEWRDLGTIDHSLSQFAADVDKVLTVRISWPEGVKPTISEVIAYNAPYTPEVVDKTNLETAIKKYDTLSLDEFKADSKAALEDAGARAKRVMAADGYSQASIDSETAKLNLALLNARKTVSAEALENLK